MAAMTNGIVLRTPNEQEFARYIAPLSIAFNEEISPAAVEHERHTIELERFIGALDGDNVVGCSGAYSFRLTVPGGEVGAAGVTAVGVLPTHRRRGILRQMMRWLFDQARDRHEAVAILWASEAAIYQRFGFGPGSLSTTFEAPRDKIVFRQPIEMGGQIRLVGIDEAMAPFAQIYERLRPSIPGALNRTEARWRWEVLEDPEWHRHGMGTKHLALLEADGEPRGYVIYRTRADWDTTGPKGVVTIIELYAVDPTAEQALWEWVVGIDLIATVRGWRSPSPNPLQLLVTEPRRLGISTSDGTWVRILDLPDALAARGYRGSGQLVLDVTDEFCPWNAGRWRLQASDGAAIIEPAGDVPPDIALDIADVNAVYLGAFRFSDLRRAGRVRECRAGAIAEADVLFATDRNPFTSTMF